MENKLSQQVLERIGVEKVLSYEVTSRDIRRFSQVIGAGDPQILDDGRLVAPPLFCQTFMFEDVPIEQLPLDGSPIELDVPIPAQRTVGGQSDFEIHRRVMSGDKITVRSKLKDVLTKQGKSGLLYLIVVHTSFHNQRDELVSQETATYVKRI